MAGTDTAKNIAEKLKNLDRLKRQFKELTAGRTSPLKPGPAPTSSAEQKEEQHRKRARNLRERQTRAGQEIGPLPEVKNWLRREACLADPEKFLREYFGFGRFFSKPFSDDHRKVIQKDEDAVRNGGLFALALPRGHGKTTLCRAFAIRAIAYGLRRFPFLVSATSAMAMDSLDTIKEMIMTSQAFIEDFPEIMVPVLALGGSVNRQKGQRCNGELTKLQWSGDFIRLPTIHEQPSVRPEQLRSSGALCAVSGLLGSKTRGMNKRGLRPDMLILDDPSTPESALKDSACEKREVAINAMVMGLSGPGIRLAAIMPCTVIREGDLADRFLDHTKHPEWAIERTALLHAFPTNTQLWENYAEIRKNYNPYAGPEDKRRAETEATLFYIDNHERMAEGAVVSWPERHEPDEVDALQFAMNKHAENRRAFYAEMQNKPLPPDLGDIKQLTADEICEKLNGVPRELVPLDAEMMTAFIDVQKSCLYWLVAGWKHDFTGHVIDYGVYPKQGRPYFTLGDISVTLERALDMKGIGEEAVIRKGLENLTTWLMTKEWERENKNLQRIDFMLIDSGKWSEMVYEFCRRCAYSPRVLPSKGIYFGASSKKATGEGALKPGDKAGWHWSLPAPKDQRGVKLLLYDTNPWKSFVHARLATVQSAAGSLSLFGRDQSAHRMIADHLLAEYRDRNTSERTGRTVEEWHAKPGEPDNHLFDCIVGAAVAANVQGIALEGVFRSTKPKPRGPRKTIDQIKAERAAARAKLIAK